MTRAWAPFPTAVMMRRETRLRTPVQRFRIGTAQAHPGHAAPGVTAGTHAPVLASTFPFTPSPGYMPDPRTAHPPGALPDLQDSLCTRSGSSLPGAAALPGRPFTGRFQADGSAWIARLLAGPESRVTRGAGRVGALGLRALSLRLKGRVFSSRRIAVMPGRAGFEGKASPGTPTTRPLLRQ